MCANENFKFWSVEQKSWSTDLKNFQRTLIKCMVMKVRFRSVEQKILFNRPKKSSRDVSLMHMVMNFWFRSVEQKIFFKRPKNCSRDLSLDHSDKF